MSRILIAYGSRAQSTREVAAFMADVLEETNPNLNVDVLSVKDTKRHDFDVSVYNAAIIGTATRNAAPLPEVVRFVRENGVALRKIPTAYFVVCLTLKDDTPENRAIVRKYLNPLVTLNTPTEIGMFAGRFDPKLLEQPWRFMMSRGKSGIPEGDFRNWDAIRAWTEAVANLLLPVPA